MEKERKVYNRPEVMAAEMGQLEVLMTSGKRSSYGKANQGFSEAELDSDGNWKWD